MFTGHSWDGIELRGIEKIDPDSTTTHASSSDTSYHSTSVPARSPLSPQVSWPSASRSPQASWRADQVDCARLSQESPVSPALLSPNHSQVHISTTPKLPSTPSQMSPNTKTPPHLSPNEWPYQENVWDFSSSSTSPQGSPFRVPRGRPPSRSNHSSTSSTPQSPTFESESTFLKPFPPCNRDNQLNLETQPTYTRHSEIVKNEFHQDVIVKSEFENYKGDWRNQWSPQKQMAWNDNFVRQSYPSASSHNKSWQSDFHQKQSNSNDGYLQHSPNNNYKVPFVKQETPGSWQDMKDMRSPNGNISPCGTSSLSGAQPNSLSGHEFGSFCENSNRPQDVKPLSVSGSVPYGYQVRLYFLY